MEFTEEQQNYINKLITDEKEKWVNDELEPIKAQVKELEQYRPKIKSDQEKALEQKEIELWQKEKNLILKENGLHEFADFFVATNIKQLNRDIEKLNKILEVKKFNNSYVPDGHKGKTDSYTQAKKNNDTFGMVKALFSK
ncbi:hypothetical protein [Desulforamulus ruminis]|uniref:Uncharacterized protein n=1 Tax=Desulforamulus ruminis (strain ATCC 23193 / DSM 2154 / NCIMB 8452 / DL) TaxID=696281 RepID=F6DRX8_DESRL|nr:hypothetical protein [Desulforamulus ruminis]AEG61002.1 hypothetical protein Desru_2787 [Desulforamulus ruminis DSM 2154]